MSREPAPVVLRPARLDDAEMLRRWRNDEETRRQSFFPGSVGRDDHRRWLEEKLAATATTRVYVGEVAGRPVGQVRVDRTEARRGVVSVAVAPEARGRGVGTVLIALGSARAARELALDEIDAFVKESNVASLRAFRRAGYRDGRTELRDGEPVVVLEWRVGAAPRDDESSAARLVRNTLVNALGSASGVVVTLLLTPYMLDRLGGSAYGIWILATTFTVAGGYLALADLGAQQAAVRFIADARGHADERAARAAFTNSLVLYSAVCVILAPALVVAAPAFADVLSIGPARHDDAVLAFQLAAATLVFDLPAMAFRAALEGAQRFVAMRLIDVLRAVGLAVAIVVVLALGHGLVALAGSLLAFSALTAAATVAFVTATDRFTRFDRSTVAARDLKQLLGFGGALFVLRVTSVIHHQMDRLIIGIVLGTALIASYEIANKIQAAATLVLSLTASALLPAAAFIGRDRARLRELFLRGTCYTVAVATPVTLAAMLYARPLVLGWVGERWEESVGLTRLFLVWLLLASVTTIGWSILVALGRLRPIVVLNIAAVAVNLVVSIALVFPLGVRGVIFGTIASTALVTIGYVRLFLEELEVGVAEWARRTLRPNVPGIVVVAALGLPLVPLVERGPQLPSALAAGTAVTAASLASFLLAGLRGEERRTLLLTLARATGLGRRRQVVAER